MWNRAELKGKAKFSFKRNYWKSVFIIPGIVKSYEYQMIPYLLAENPQMSREQAYDERSEVESITELLTGHQ